MKLSTTSRLVLAGLVLVPALTAQITTKQTRYFKSYGLSEANVWIDLGAKAHNGFDQVQIKGGGTPILFSNVGANAYAKGGITVLGWTATALSLEAGAYSNRFGTNANVRAVVAGVTMLNETKSSTGAWSKSFGPYDLFDTDPSFSTSIAGISVSVSCNVGGGAELVFGYILDGANRRIALGGDGRVYGTGRATAKAGALGFYAGVRADLRFLDSTGSPSMSATMTGISGYLTLTLKPLSISLRAFVEVPIFGEVGSVGIWSWSASPHTATYQLF